MRFASELLQIPGPENVYPDVLRRALLLEELGFDIGMVGHHRFVQGNPSAVFTLLSAVAARTERIMLGPGILVLPAYHPLDVAEGLATLDQVSGGRAFLGVGSGYRDHELQATGLDPADRGSLVTEALEVLHAVWHNDVASYDGKHFSFDEVSIAPRVVQRPHPLVIVGTKGKIGARRAGRLADGILGGLMQSVDEYRPAIEHNRAAAQEHGRTSRLWLQRSVCIAPTRSELEEEWLPGFLENRRAKLALGPGLAASALDFAIVEGRTPTLEEAADYALIGTAEEVIEQIRQLQQTVEIDALVVNHHWSTGDNDRIERQLRLFAEEVLPAFR